MIHCHPGYIGSPNSSHDLCPIIRRRIGNNGDQSWYLQHVPYRDMHLFDYYIFDLMHHRYHNRRRHICPAQVHLQRSPLDTSHSWVHQYCASISGTNPCGDHRNPHPRRRCCCYTNTIDTDHPVPSAIRNKPLRIANIADRCNLPDSDRQPAACTDHERRNHQIVDLNQVLLRESIITGLIQKRLPTWTHAWLANLRRAQSSIAIISICAFFTVITAGGISATDANTSFWLAHITMAIAFAPLTRREIPETRRARTTIPSGDVRPTVTCTANHITQIVQCARVVTITFRAAVR